MATKYMYNWLNFIYSLELLYYMVRLCRWMRMKARERPKHVRFFISLFIVLMHLILCELHAKKLQNNRKKETSAPKKIYLYLLKWSQWWENVYFNTLCEHNRNLNNSQFGSKPVKRKVNKSDARTTYIGKRFHVSNYFSLIMWNTNVNPGESVLFSVKRKEWSGMKPPHRYDNRKGDLIFIRFI